MTNTQQADGDPPKAQTSCEQDKGALQLALEHRFRHTLRSGQVSPLLHLVLRHKQEVSTCTPNT